MSQKVCFVPQKQWEELWDKTPDGRKLLREKGTHARFEVKSGSQSVMFCVVSGYYDEEIPREKADEALDVLL